jgi:hypothetical protein
MTTALLLPPRLLVPPHARVLFNLGAAPNLKVMISPPNQSNPASYLGTFGGAANQFVQTGRGAGNSLGNNGRQLKNVYTLQALHPA